MALEIRQNLGLSQQLVITPQLQQAIKLLQLSRLELENLVQHELLENPILEETPEEEEKVEEVSVTEPMTLAHEVHDREQKTDEVGTRDGEFKEPNNFDWENYLGNFNAPEARMSGMAETPDDLPPFENAVSGGTTLQDHLLWQLHMSDLNDPEEAEIAEELIGNVNDDGYLQANLEDIANTVGREGVPIPLDKVEEVLLRLQEFDPPGVAARTLPECLKIQTRAFDEKDRILLDRVITDHLEDMEKKNYTAILRDLRIPMERMKELAHLISTLEPKPGRPFGLEKPQYIIPDVYVEKLGEEYVVLLNDDGLPKLQVSTYYRNALFQKDMPSPAKEYIQDKLRSALWLIRSIHQRQRTLYRVTSTIVKFQKEFLEKGIAFLKPMILRDVAEEIRMHESTISRVTTNKYVQTPRGLFELKFFFNPKVAAGNGGDGLTPEAVRDEIRKMIANEDQKRPLSDQLICELLQKNNIQIARRTVAKYREMLGIMPASRRREVF